MFNLPDDEIARKIQAVEFPGVWTHDVRVPAGNGIPDERSCLMLGTKKDKAKRLRLERALKEAAGAWKDADHPEIVEKGTSAWVREMREETERRIQPKEAHHVESNG